jgi:threonine/homoserine/homoserine lactone efflux protein
LTERRGCEHPEASLSLSDWLARQPGLIVWQERLAGVAMIALGARLLMTGWRGR